MKKILFRLIVSTLVLSLNISAEECNDDSSLTVALKSGLHFKKVEDYANAAKCFEIACENESSNGCFMAAIVYELMDPEKYRKRSLKYYSSSCYGGNVDGCIEAGKRYLASGNGLFARNMFKRGCAVDKRACGYVFVMNLRGIVSEMDSEEKMDKEMPGFTREYKKLKGYCSETDEELPCDYLRQVENVIENNPIFTDKMQLDADIKGNYISALGCKDSHGYGMAEDAWKIIQSDGTYYVIDFDIHCGERNKPNFITTGGSLIEDELILEVKPVNIKGANKFTVSGNGDDVCMRQGNDIMTFLPKDQIERYRRHLLKLQHKKSLSKKEQNTMVIIKKMLNPDGYVIFSKSTDAKYKKVFDNAPTYAMMQAIKTNDIETVKILLRSRENINECVADSNPTNLDDIHFYTPYEVIQQHMKKVPEIYQLFKRYEQTSTCTKQKNKKEDTVKKTKRIENIRPSWCTAPILNKTERTICTDVTLSALDIKLAEIYGASKARYKDIAQRNWLKKRNRCGSNVSCIKSTYEERIHILQAASKKDLRTTKAMQEKATKQKPLLSKSDTLMDKMVLENLKKSMHYILDRDMKAFANITDSGRVFTRTVIEKVIYSETSWKKNFLFLDSVTHSDVDTLQIYKKASRDKERTCRYLATGEEVPCKSLEYCFAIDDKTLPDKGCLDIYYIQGRIYWEPFGW